MGIPPEGEDLDPCALCKGAYCESCRHYSTHGGNAWNRRRMAGLPFHGYGFEQPSLDTDLRTGRKM